MDNPEPRSQYLNVVLRQISRTSLRIPRFQRHFVWNERDVVELLGSIHKGFPIGSVLTWRVESHDNYFSGFRHDPFPEADPAVNTFEVVLDGAQRLSTLFGCLRNAASDSIYSVIFDTRDESFRHLDEREPEAWQIPMDTLFDSRRFLEVQANLSVLEDSDTLVPRALDLYSTFQDYQIPIIAISNAVLEDVVEVFRRVNSSGTPLSSVDFVRALTWQSSFDLEETFDGLVERFQATPLEGFSEDFLVRCLSIAAGLTLDSRDVGQLKHLSARQGGLAGEISSMESALEHVARFLAKLNVHGIREIPYEVQRLLLFSFKLYEMDVADDALEEWFWRSTFAEEHQSKPESYTTRLVKAMRDGDAAPALEVRKPIDPDLLAIRSRRSGSAVATGFDLLLRRMGARSLLSGDKIAIREGLHGFLFNRSELTDARNEGLAVPTGGALANVVLLSPNDAAEWRTLRKEASLEELFAECDSRTGQASEIWESQGLSLTALANPSLVLRQRSARLLSEVVPIEITPRDDGRLHLNPTPASPWHEIQGAVQRFVGFDPAVESVGDRLTDLRLAMIRLVDELDDWVGLDDWLENERLLGAEIGRRVMDARRRSESLEDRVKRVEPYQLWAQDLSNNLRLVRRHGHDPQTLAQLRERAQHARSGLGGPAEASET